MDAGDWAAWTGAMTGGIALIVSIASAVTSVKSLYWERDSADSARRSAEAAERANMLSERAIERGFPSATISNAGTEVEWTLSKSGRNRYVLRNIGSATAEHVAVSLGASGVVHRDLPTDAVVRPNEATSFLMLGTWGSPVPDQVWVTWGDHGVEVAVPVPSD